MVELRRELPPVRQRVQRMYLEFAWQSLRYGGRKEVVSCLRKNASAVLQRSRMAQRAMWRERGRFAFVVSPNGAGLDCHRTWEALALGHIVLVPSSPLDPLFEGLAVIPVRRWDSITESDLGNWLERYEPLTRDNPRLTSAWWVNRMREKAGR